jgi:hypothetical protein
MIMHYDYTMILRKKNNAELLQDTKNWKKNQEIKMIDFLRQNGPLKCHTMIRKGKHNCVLQKKIHWQKLEAPFKKKLTQSKCIFFSSKCMS